MSEIRIGLDHSLWIPIIGLLKASLQIFTVALLGFFFAKRNVFPENVQKSLSYLNLNYFTPALIFYNVSKSFNTSSFKDVLLVPVVFMIIVSISAVTAILIANAFGLSGNHKRFVKAFVIFQNSSTLPLSLIKAIALNVPGLEWSGEQNDSPEKIMSRGILYVLIFSQLGQQVRWTYGYSHLMKYIDDESDIEEDVEHNSVIYHRKVLGRKILDRPFSPDYRSQSSEDLRTPLLRNDRSVDTKKRKNSAGPSLGNRNATWNMKDEQDAPLKTSTNVETETENHDAYDRRQKRSCSSRLGKKMRRSNQHLWHTLLKCKKSGLWTGTLAAIRAIFPPHPPALALILALTVVIVPGMQDLLFKEGSFLEGSFIYGISLISDLAIPLLLIGLGASFGYDNESSRRQLADRTNQKMIWASVLGRMFIVPLIIVPPSMLFLKYFSFGAFEDPIFVITCFLQIGSPSALNLYQIACVNGFFEEIASRLMLIEYVSLSLDPSPNIERKFGTKGDMTIVKLNLQRRYDYVLKRNNLYGYSEYLFTRNLNAGIHS